MWYTDTIMMNTIRMRDWIIMKTIFNTCIKVYALLNSFIIVSSDSGGTYETQARTSTAWELIQGHLPSEIPMLDIMNICHHLKRENQTLIDWPRA